MPQRKKSKTKKAMKKSINSLWKSLHKEKLKHAKATKRINSMRQLLQDLSTANKQARRTIYDLEVRLDDQLRKEDYNAKFVADLISRLT